MDKTEYTAPSAEQIAKWKKEHPKGVIQISLTIPTQPNKKFDAYLRTPDMADIQRAIASDRKKPFSAGQSIWENCKLSAHPEIEKDDSLLMGLFVECANTFDIADSTSKKV
jgi:hypothetical protein